MNPRKAAIALGFVIERDGTRCHNHDGKLFPNPNCKPYGGKSGLYLDHVDNDPENNNPANWQALCPSCNAKKNPRGTSKRGIRVRAQIMDRFRDNSHGKDSSEYESARELGERQSRTFSLEMLKNREAEGKYRNLITSEIMKAGAMKEEDAIDGGAEVAQISQQTAARYLKKLCSRFGPLMMMTEGEERYVAFKSEFIPEEPETAKEAKGAPVEGAK